MASGDTVYVGAGVYRESFSVAMTAPTATTSIIGDVDGAQTGDAGEVRWSGFTSGPRRTGADHAVELAGRPFLSFSNLVFEISGGSGRGAIQNLSGNCHDLTITNCAFQEIGFGACVYIVCPVDVAANITIDRCLMQTMQGGVCIGFDMPTSSIADYDNHIIIRNSVLIDTAGNGVNFNPTGALAFKPGGATVTNCTIMASGSSLLVVNVNFSTTFKLVVNNCMIFGVLSANNTSQVSEDYNVFRCGTARSNVSIGAHSINFTWAPGFSIGQETVWGGEFARIFTPTQDSPLLGYGSAASPPSVDLLNRPRPAGNYLGASGTATSGAAKTLTDSGATWGTNAFLGWFVLLTGGTGSGQVKRIASNTGTVLTVDGNWKTNPDATTTYQVYPTPASTTGKATAGSTTTLTDGNAAWEASQWVGYTLHIDSGTGSGQTLAITANTTTGLTFAAATAPDSTSTYSIYQSTGVTAAQNSIGPYERHDSAQKESVIVDAGTAIKLVGPADHDYVITVDAVSTTITIKYRSDANAVPTAQVLANGEIGVSASAVQTGISSQGTYTTLTIPAFTPTAKGDVILRLTSGATTATGIAYFDTAGIA